MSQKIKIAVVDDDDSMHDILHDLYSDSGMIEIKYNYTDARKFLEEVPGLIFDLCFLDVSMPNLDGITLGQLLKNKPLIFITGSEDRLKDALSLAPIDVVTKPFTKMRLDQAVEKAYKLMVKKMEHGVFSVAESLRKVNINLADIVFADTDEIDPRNKPVVLRDGTRYTLMDCNMEDLLSMAPQLIQVNRRQLVALDSIGNLQHDVIGVKDAKALNLPGEITLGRKYNSDVKKRMFFK
jgi:DNA-binding LytR/AlgR family response regulator